MKIMEARNLTIGSIVANKLNQYKITDIHYQNDKIVSFELQNDDAIRTLKLDSMRKYEIVKLQEEVEEIEVPNILVIPELPLLLQAPQEIVEEVQDLESDCLHVFKEANKNAKTDNDTLLLALAEVLSGAKKSQVCKKYNIPSYRFSRVLNFKYGRPSLRSTVYDLCKLFNKLDMIKHIELYEEV